MVVSLAGTATALAIALLAACGQPAELVVSGDGVPVYGAIPQTAAGKETMVAGLLEAGSRYPITDTYMMKDFIVYKIEDRSSRDGLDVGYVIFDSRSMAVVK